MVSHTTDGTTSNSGMELIKHRLLSGGAWALGGRVVLAFIGLATNALLARLLIPAELGIYFLAYSVMGVCVVLGALGLTKAVVRFVAQSVGLEQYTRTRQAIKLAMGFGSLGALVVGGAYLLFGGGLATTLFDSPAFAAVAGLTAGWIAVEVIRAIMAETFRGFHDIRGAVILGGFGSGGNGILSGGLLSFLLLLLFMSRGEAGVGTVILLAVISGGASALLAGLLLWRKVDSLPQDASDVRAGEMMHAAWPLMVTTLFALALTQSSLWIAGAFLGQEEVALYGAAYRLMVYVAIPLQIANVVAPPLIAEMYAQNRVGELQRILRALTTLSGIPAFLLLAAFVLLGSPIMGLIFGDYYREAAGLLALLSIGQIMSVLVGSCGEALMMTGHQSTVMVVTIFTGLLTVAGSIWAVQHYGTIGLAGAVAGGLVLQNTAMLLAIKLKVGIWTHATFKSLTGVLDSVVKR